MNFGIIDKVFYDEYLSNQPCLSCQNSFETKLVIYCKAFVTGPLTWWAWNKKGCVECKSCDTVSKINPAQNEFRNIRERYSNKSIPLHFYIPSVVMGLLLLAATLMISVKVIYNATTSTDQKLTGTWEDSTGKALFVFKDHQFALLQKDTIIFGQYKVDKNTGHISLPLDDVNNELDKIDIEHLELNVSSGQNSVFTKIASSEKGENPYHIEYNKWRFPAIHEESKEMIKARVIGYLTFLKMRYEWVLANQLTNLSPDFNSPIFEAQNGVALYPRNYPRWRFIFSSYDDFDYGNHFLAKAFPSNYQLDKNEKSVFRQNLGAMNAYIKSAESTKAE